TPPRSAASRPAGPGSSPRRRRGRGAGFKFRLYYQAWGRTRKDRAPAPPGRPGKARQAFPGVSRVRPAPGGPMAGKPEPAPGPRADEERLAHALVSRGLVTPEELRGCSPAPGAPEGPEALLGRLVAAGLLTAGQARRAREELSRFLNQPI